MTLFAGFVSLVFSLVTQDDPVQQLRFGAMLWVALSAGAVVFGWLMYPLPL
jgi:hypothetical protein